MAGELWVVAETSADGSLARISTEVATLTRGLAAASGREAVGVVVGSDPGPAASALADFLPRVLAVTEAAAADRPIAGVVAERVAALAAERGAGWLLLGASPDGRDAAGVLSVRLGWGVLANATGASWSDHGPAVEMSVFGGSLVTTSTFTGSSGIVTVRPSSVTAEALSTPGVIEPVSISAALALPAVAVRERVVAEGAQASIEEAKIIVSGGRGVGGPEGFRLVQDLADELGGAVGASRAAVDSGWIPYSQQIGQTGKIVKPQLYLALGISGAIQHKVGMQTAETIVAINRDPDAPLAEFADLYVIGDLFEVGPALLAELRARAGEAGPRPGTPMPEVALLLPFALGIAIAAATWIVLSRTGIVAAESRDASSGRAAIAALAARADGSLGEVAARIDRVRRGQVEASELADPLPVAQAEVAALAADGRASKLPAGLQPIRDEIVEELDRAGRALDMVEHGRTIMLAARLRGREVEAQTAIKRGYLNLLHAREAIARAAGQAAAWRSPTEARRDARRAR